MLNLWNMQFARHRQQRRERGAFFVLLAVSLLAVMLVLAVVLAVGYHTNARAKFKNISNLASLAAVEEFFSNEAITDPVVRATNAKARVRSIMRSNRLLGAASYATDSEVYFADEGGGTGSIIRFGVWHSREPAAGGPAVCAGHYPCFEEVSPPSAWGPPNEAPLVNTVKIETRTQSPVLAPFGAVLGEGVGEFMVATSATATVVPRCSVFLLDASLSTTNDSHPSRQRGVELLSGGCTKSSASLCPELPVGTPLFSPPARYLCPRSLSLFAFNDWISYDRAQSLRKEVRDTNVTVNPLTPCATATSWLYGTNSVQPTETLEGHLWCNLMLETIGPLDPRPCGDHDRPPTLIRETGYPNGASGPHGLCYERERTPYGEMLIDKCNDPEPLSSFMLGFNAGVRMLQSQKTAADRVRMSIFRGVGEIHPYPPDSDGPNDNPGFTSDPSAMVQLTNVKNRGTIGAPYPIGSTPSYIDAELHPNFVDQGWFPIMQRGALPANIPEQGTNIVDALERAMNILSDPQECPSGAQKSIILATDGVSTCNSDLDPDCGTAYLYYTSAEQRLINGMNSILNQLRVRKIALTTLLAGGEVQPNIVSRERVPGSGEFLSFRDAVALGYRGLTDMGGGVFQGDSSADDQLLSDSSPVCMDSSCPGSGEPLATRDRFAFMNMSARDGILFRRPNGVMAHMSIESGGVFCPLLPTGDPTLYFDDDGDPQTPEVLVSRNPGEILTISPSYLKAGEIAAECVRQTLGSNPFALVEE